MAETKELSTAAKLAIALQENRELTRKLYTLRGEAPPNEHGDDYSTMGEPVEAARPLAWEIYAGLPGVDNQYSGLSKRTPTGGFFSSGGA